MGILEKLGIRQALDRIGRSRLGEEDQIVLHGVLTHGAGHRTVHVNSPEANRHFRYKSNSVSTTKYSVLTFLPKGLFEQFRRVANLYFLLIAILSATPVSPVHPITNIAPLVVVLTISLIKEAFEDRKRYLSDRVINNNKVEVLRSGQWTPQRWSKVAAGDIVRVKQDQYFPADLACLASANPEGICYIETMNLDGETNLKIRKALERTWDCVTAEAASQFRGARVECEQPNNSLYTFTGNLVIGEKNTIPLGPNQILLRGCSLRNTEFVVGVVIFTGHETKVMMNSMDVPSKRSTLERRLDKLILLLFAILFAICFIGAVGSAIFVNHKYWYLGLAKGEVDPQNNPDQPLGVFFLRLFTLVTLYSTVIPISLYVSIEIIKFLQVTHFINQDRYMYHRESDTPAMARTSNLNEELGQIEYIFTDKTGTLTRNLMEFFKCSIGGVMYGTGITEVQRAAAAREGRTLEEPVLPEDVSMEKGFNFYDKRLMKGAWRNEPAAEVCKEFFRLLAVCHTVLPEGEETPEGIEYQAASPDELALVVAAKHFGFFFYHRTPTHVRVREAHVEKLGRIADREYEILNVLEFNSTRKRQSVVCRFSDGRLVLYCKGADTVIFERLAEKGNKYKEVTRQALEKYGADGLRTLCLAYVELDPAMYEDWNEKFIQAKSALRDREKRLDAVAELIEKNLILLGCTAIEDKLQAGVPQCIELLAEAGLKMWVLTGDKMETAINIAYACNLLNNEQHHFMVSSETEAVRALEDAGDQLGAARVLEEEVTRQLTDALHKSDELRETKRLGLIIDGRCLMYALDPRLRGVLLELGMRCKAVVCCRVSPLQKAQVTTLIKDGAGRITLSIGDGANDVSMIQAAHIGVGISGQEGMQAVMAADFSIAQFRFLTELLLVHGRWSYIRISKVVMYFFYKNLAFTLTQFWFNCFTGFSGQRFYDDWFQSLYNVTFTALPVIVLGILEQDVDRATSKHVPELYKAGINNEFFNWHVIIRWLVFSLYQCLVFFFFPTAVLEGAINSSGRTISVWEVGTLAYTVVIITVNVRLLLECNYLTKIHHVAIWGSIASWFVFVLIYCGIRPGTTRQLDTQDNLYFSFFLLLSAPGTYLTMLLVPVVALMGDFLFLGAQRRLKPHLYQIIQDKHLDGLEERRPLDRLQRLEMQELNAPPVEMTGEDVRTMGMVQLPSLRSKRHTGFAFDTPGFDSFFAAQHGVAQGEKAWDVAQRMSMPRRQRAGASHRRGESAAEQWGMADVEEEDAGAGRAQVGPRVDRTLSDGRAFPSARPPPPPPPHLLD